jgi:protein ImuA
MHVSSPDMIESLRKEILRLGGIKSPRKDLYRKDGLAWMNDHFPNGTFPTAAVHEFQCSEPESMAASLGFIAAVNHELFSPEAVIVWIASETNLYPPALTMFNLKPHHVLCIYPNSVKERIWVMEEALKCKGLHAVIAELNGFDFTQSRRFQLAVEQSGVTGFILNSKQGPVGTNACVSRWKISSLPSQQEVNFPGVGFPSWHVELEKMRNGKNGRWKICWMHSRFELIEVSSLLVQEQTEKWAV